MDTGLTAISPIQHLARFGIASLLLLEQHTVSGGMTKNREMVQKLVMWFAVHAMQDQILGFLAVRLPVLTVGGLRHSRLLPIEPVQFMSG
jgi:hypothetical protein